MRSADHGRSVVGALCIAAMVWACSSSDSIAPPASIAEFEQRRETREFTETFVIQRLALPVPG